MGPTAKEDGLKNARKRNVKVLPTLAYKDLHSLVYPFPFPWAATLNNQQFPMCASVYHNTFGL